MARAAGAVGATVIAICLLCAPVAVAGPRPDERYDGRSAMGNRIMLSVRSDGSRLHRYFFGVRIRCTDGSRRLAGLRHPRERPVAIDAGGTFAHRSPAYRYRYGRARELVRVSFSGTFDASGGAASRLACARTPPHGA